MSESLATETEIAFELIGNNRALLEHPLLLDIETNTNGLHTTYFDTAEFKVRNAGLTISLRRDDTGRCTQRVKGKRQHAVRSETEFELDPSQTEIDRDLLSATPASALLSEDDKLIPILRSDISRMALLVVTRTGTVEVAIDSGLIATVNSHPRSVVVRDMELETKVGGKDNLYRIAAALTSVQNTLISSETKAERGYRLLTGESVPVSKGISFDVKSSITARDGFRDIAASIVEQIIRNGRAAHDGSPDGIHQVRVGIRRLRTLFRMFKDELPLDTVKTFDHQLRLFSRILGDARDQFVFRTQTLPFLTKRPSPAEAEWLDMASQFAERDEKPLLNNVREMLQSSVYTSTIMGILAWSEDLSQLSFRTRFFERPLGDVLGKLLTGLARAVDRRRHDIAGHEERQHDLRKAIKRMRYGLEFVQHIYPESRVKRYLKSYENLQDDLGAINDLIQTQHLMENLALNHTTIAPLLGTVDILLTKRRKKLNRKLSKSSVPSLKSAFWK